MSDAPKWVTVGTYWEPTRAHLVKLKLEAEGFTCRLDNELFVATNWLAANASGGIKLQVPENEEAAVRELLASLPVV